MQNETPDEAFEDENEGLWDEDDASRTFADDYAEGEDDAADADYFGRGQEPDSDAVLGLRAGGPY